MTQPRVLMNVLLTVALLLSITSLSSCKTAPTYGWIDFANQGENYWEFNTSRLAVGIPEEMALTSVINSRGERVRCELYESDGKRDIYKFDRYQARVTFDSMAETLYLLIQNGRLKSWTIVEGKGAPPNEWPPSPSGMASDNYSQRRNMVTETIELTDLDKGFRIGIAFDDQGVIWDISEHAINSGLELGDIVANVGNEPISSFPKDKKARFQKLHELVNESASNGIPITLSIKRNGSNLRVLIDPIDTTALRDEMMVYVSKDDWGALWNHLNLAECDSIQYLAMRWWLLQAKALENWSRNEPENNLAFEYAIFIEDVIQRSQYSYETLDLAPRTLVYYVVDLLQKNGNPTMAVGLLESYREVDKERTRSAKASSVPTQSRGTGFFVSPNGIVVTAFHVIENAESITITMHNGVEYDAELISFSKANDLALLKVNAKDASYLPLKETSSIQRGSDVFTMGFPATEILGEEIKYSDGSIASLSGVQGEQSLIQITIPIQPGNSGGPIITEDGFVVGMVTSTAAIMPFIESTGSLPQNVNWAVKSDYIMLLSDYDSDHIAVDKSEALNRAEAATCRVTTNEN